MSIIHFNIKIKMSNKYALISTARYKTIPVIEIIGTKADLLTWLTKDINDEDAIIYYIHKLEDPDVDKDIPVSITWYPYFISEGGDSYKEGHTFFVQKINT
jgi:hypothetical protein